MNKEIKQKWIEALRSGKYKQGRECLRNEHNEYCCLGVLCDIINPEGWDKDYLFRDAGLMGHVLPPSSFDVYVTKANMYHLIDMNDTGSTFSEIADWIEQQENI